MADRKLIELLIEEGDDLGGVEAISLVKFPAIEENFMYFNRQGRQVMLAEVDEEQRTLIGPALIPNKEIVRYDEANDEEYDVYFSEATVKQASELFMMQERTNSHTFEHQDSIDGVSVVESWIIADEDQDKSKVYGMSMPKGTWMVRVKVNNDDVWDSVKNKDVRGFSIEGYFVDKIEKMHKERSFADSYSDYPESASNNAKRALKYAEENGWGDCGTDVGKQRANQLAKSEPISMETISRAYSFLSRHAENADVPYGEGCGGLMYDAWGGKSMLNWAEGKVNANKEKTEASAMSKKRKMEDPCWDGYEMVGMKEKDGKMVPNCVPIEASKETMMERMYRAVMSILKPMKFYAEAMLSNGDTIITEAEELAEGVEVYKLDEEGMPIAIDSGDYETEGGVKISIQDGKIVSFGTDEEAQPTEEELFAERVAAEYEKLKTRYNMSRYTIKDIGLCFEPYDLNYRGSFFWIKPFQHSSWKSYNDAVEDAKANLAPEVEEWELVDTDFIPFTYFDGADYLTEEKWDELKEIDDSGIPVEIVTSALGDVADDVEGVVERYAGEFRNDLEMATEYIDSVYGADIPKDLAENYFGFDTLGNDLKAGGDLYSMIMEDWEDRYETEVEAEAAYDELYDMRDAELGEWYVYDVVGDLASALGDRVSDYFDYKKFARDLMYDMTEYDGHYFYRS